MVGEEYFKDFFDPGEVHIESSNYTTGNYAKSMINFWHKEEVREVKKVEPIAPTQY